MKYVRFRAKEQDHYGILEGEVIKGLAGDFFSQLIFSGKEFLISQVKLLPPVLPSKIVAVGLNYRDHIEEMNHEVPKEPVIFLKPTSAVIGEGDAIVIPPMSRQVDYEAEFAAVIAKPVRNISPAQARLCVLGYTCLNDVTARDIQAKDGQWIRAKGFDTFAPIGPYIDDSLNPDHTDVKLLLNGDIRQHSNTNQFLFPVDELISFISKVMTLEPGDVVTTGTPSGIGKMQAGDQVSVILNDQLILTNKVEESYANSSTQRND